MLAGDGWDLVVEVAEHADVEGRRTLALFNWVVWLQWLAFRLLSCPQLLPWLGRIIVEKMQARLRLVAFNLLLLTGAEQKYHCK